MSFFSLVLILKRIDEQNLRVTDVKSTLLFTFEMALTHTPTNQPTNTQWWRMVDSSCIYSLWFFSSFRFECLAIRLQWRNTRWVVLRIIHFIMWMFVCCWCCTVRWANARCTMYNCVCCAMLKCGASFIFSNCLWHGMNAHSQLHKTMYSEKCYDISRYCWIVRM